MVLSFNPFRGDVRRHFHFQMFMDHGCCCGELTKITQATFEVTLASTVEKKYNGIGMLDSLFGLNWSSKVRKSCHEMQASVMHSDHALACTCANSHKFDFACDLACTLSIQINKNQLTLENTMDM